MGRVRPRSALNSRVVVLRMRAAGPESDLLRRLNAGDETPAGPVWATIRSTTDQVVTPVDSALSGALNIVVQDVCPGSVVAHGDLPRHPVVLAALDTVLGAKLSRYPVASPADVFSRRCPWYRSWPRQPE